MEIMQVAENKAGAGRVGPGRTSVVATWLHCLEKVVFGVTEWMMSQYSSVKMRAVLMWWFLASRATP